MAPSNGGSQVTFARPRSWIYVILARHVPGLAEAVTRTFAPMGMVAAANATPVAQVQRRSISEINFRLFNLPAE